MWLLLHYNVIVTKLLQNVNNNFFRKGDTMYNNDIRTEATNSGVKLWQIAEKLGINDGNFSRKLRKELSLEEKAKIREIIAELKEVSE